MSLRMGSLSSPQHRTEKTRKCLVPRVIRSCSVLAKLSSARGGCISCKLVAPGPVVPLWGGAGQIDHDYDILLPYWLSAHCHLTQPGHCCPSCASPPEGANAQTIFLGGDAPDPYPRGIGGSRSSPKTTCIPTYREQPPRSERPLSS